MENAQHHAEHRKADRKGYRVLFLIVFAGALMAARPDLPKEDVYWRLHFTLGMLHNNRFAEFDRLNVLSEGATSEGDVEALLARMLAFAEAGFAA